MKSQKITLLALSACILFSCNSEEEVRTCTATVEPSLRFTILDKDSRASIVCNTTIIVQDASYSETFDYPETDTSTCNNNVAINSKAMERPGNYNVEVRKDGYHDWTKANIKVTRSGCHVNTANLEVLMEKR